MRGIELGKLAVQVLAPLLPWEVRRRIYCSLFGWDIDQDARIGFSYVQATHVRLGPGSRIGHGNVIRRLSLLDLDRGACILNFNSVFGSSDRITFPSPILVVGQDAIITSWHFIDACGSVRIGHRTTIGGRSTQLWSHALFFRDGAHMLAPAELRIGNDVYIAARATLANCVIPDEATVSAGAVIARNIDVSKYRGPLLFVGNPAVPRERLSS